MRYEILDNEGNVINTIISSLEFVEEIYPGKYREVEEEPIRQTYFSKLEFLNRFTDEELAGILDASKINSLIAVWVKKLDLAENVNISDERIINGINKLEEFGLLSTGRAAEILA